MAEKKVCPFCLEDVPIKAAKCRHCESVIEDIPISTIETIHTSSTAPKQKVRQSYSEPDLSKLDSKWQDKIKLVFLIPLILFLLAGLGAGYWFIYRDNAEETEEAVETSVNGELRGAWRSRGPDEPVYFQFLPNDMVNIAVPAEGYWFRTQYSINNDDDLLLLALYHRNQAEWETVAEIVFKDNDTLVLQDIWDNIYLLLDRVPDSVFRDEFRDVVNDLDFQG